MSSKKINANEIDDGVNSDDDEDNMLISEGNEMADSSDEETSEE